MSGRSLCPDGVMYRGGFVKGGFVPGSLTQTIVFDENSEVMTLA